MIYKGKAITFRRYLAVVYSTALPFLIFGDLLTGTSTEGFGAGYIAGKIGGVVVPLLLVMIGAGLAMRRYGHPTRQAALA